MKNFFHMFARRRESPWLQLMDWVIVAIAIGIFTYMALPNLIHSSAYFDEGYSAYLAKQDLWTMATYTALDVHPPLYYGALHYWQLLFGDDVATLRLLSIVFGWFAIVFGFLLVRRGFGYKAAWFATLLMALSPLFIRYGSSMRMYTLALAIGLAATYILTIAVTGKKRWPWIVYAVLVAAGMWTNYFTALVWLSHLAWILYEYRRERNIVRSWCLAVAGAVILYLPWLPALVYRAGEVQVSGFWIKPLSVDTLVSTVTMSTLFRNASSTTGWLAVIAIALVVTAAVLGWQTHKQLNKQKRPLFRLIAFLSSLPIVLLAVMSLPPLRPAYTYRYVLFASVLSALFVAIIVTFATFKRHNTLKKSLFYMLAVLVFTIGAYQSMTVGNRSLDTNSQNKLSQVVDDVYTSKYRAPIIVRSPYSYYVTSLYQNSNFPMYFLYYDDLAKIGSTKPLYDNHQNGVTSSGKFDKVWLVGEDRNSVVKPPVHAWQLVDRYIEYDDLTGKPAAFAYYYERTDK